MENFKAISRNVAANQLRMQTIIAWGMLIISIPLCFVVIGIPVFIIAVVMLIRLRSVKKKLLDENGIDKITDNMSTVCAEFQDASFAKRKNSHGNTIDIASQIEKLHQLKSDGILTDTEYEKQKQLILSA